MSPAVVTIGLTRHDTEGHRSLPYAVRSTIFNRGVRMYEKIALYLFSLLLLIKFLGVSWNFDYRSRNRYYQAQLYYTLGITVLMTFIFLWFDVDIAILWVPFAVEALMWLIDRPMKNFFGNVLFEDGLSHQITKSRKVDIVLIAFFSCLFLLSLAVVLIGYLK